MAFNPDEYLKKESAGSGFNPDAYLSKADTPSNTRSGIEKAARGVLAAIPGGALAGNSLAADIDPQANRAALESYANTATFGYLPQLQAAAGALVPDPNKALDEKMRAQGFSIVVPEDSYLSRRDANIARQKEQKAQFPIATGIGTGAGILAGGLLTGGLGAGAKAKTAFDRLYNAAKLGATYGGLSNPGDIEGEIHPIQLDERAQNAAIGGALGLGVQALGEGAGKVGNWLRRKAEEKAVKAAGAYQKDMIRLSDKKDTMHKLGRTLLDEKIVTPISTPGSIAKKVGKGIESLDDKLTGLIDDAEQTIGKTEFWNSLKPDQQEKLLGSMLNPKQTANQLKSDMKKFYDAIPEEKLQPALDEIDKWFKGRNEIMTPAAIQKAKVQMNRFLKDSDFNREVGIAKEGTLAARRGFKEGVEKSADTLAEIMGTQGGQIKETNRRLGDLLEIKKIADKKAAREAANRAIGLTDTIVGMGSSAAGNEPVTKIGLGALGALLNKTGRTFGSSIQATGAEALGKSAQSIGNTIRTVAENNPNTIPVILNRLFVGEKNSPKVIDPILDNPKVIGIFRENPKLLDSVEDPVLKEKIFKRMGEGKSDRAPTQENALKRRLNR